MDQNTQFGQYSLVKKLASGGMAEIYLARAGGIRGFEKHLVLKMIHPKWSQDENFISMLIEEAKLAVHLNHANIAQIFDLGLHNDTYYIAMEYVNGRDLFQVLVRTSELDTYVPFDVAAFLTDQVAAALHYAHTRCDANGQSLNLIHRDISPQNIIISMNGEVKLIDFGIAKASMRPGHTQVGIIKGKFYYMSPEQAWGRQLDHRSDIFSLGICLHEMLTGQMLYAEDDQLQLLEKVRAADIPRPSEMRPGVPPELEAITMRALSHDPAHRFQTAFEFQRALAGYMHRNSPGFTPTRAARVMWELFPEATPKHTQEKPEVMNSRDFGAVRPPESVIFDVGAAMGARAAHRNPSQPTPPSPISTASGSAPAQPRSPRESTKPVPAVNGNHDSDVFTSSGGHFPLSRPGKAPSAGPASHPPPPLAGGAGEDSTQIVNWNQFKERHPERSAELSQLQRTAGSGNPAPPPAGLRRATAPPISSNNDDASTALFNPATMSPGAPRPAPRPAPIMPDHLDASERTMMFNPNKVAPPPSAPAPSTPPSGARPAMPPAGLRKPAAPIPVEAPEPEDRTTLFDPSKFGVLPSEDDDATIKPAPAPKKPPAGLRKSNAPAPAPSKQESRTTLFDPSMAPPMPEKPAPKPAKKPVKKPAPPKADTNDDPSTEPARPADKPMTREEKIAAAKAKAKGGGGGLAAKIKKKGEDGGGESAKPMTREEKIAAAKAKAAGGGGLAAKIKKKGAGGGDAKPMSREEKIAAAKAKAAGGGLAGKIKKKGAGGGGPKPAAKAGSDDPIKKAKAKARQRSGKADVKKPNRVDKSKGNNNVRIAGQSSTFSKVLRVLLVVGGIAFIGCGLGAYALYAEFFNKPAVPEFGAIEVTSSPTGATIEYDGIDLGAKTPYVIDKVPIGSIHRIRVTLENHQDEIRNNITVQTGSLESVHFVLKPSPGKLIVSSNPPQADVIVDGSTKCVTPCNVEDLPRQDGTFFEVILRKPGYQDNLATLKWEAGVLEIPHHADLEPVEND